MLITGICKKAGVVIQDKHRIELRLVLEFGLGFWLALLSMQRNVIKLIV